MDFSESIAEGRGPGFQLLCKVVTGSCCSVVKRRKHFGLLKREKDKVTETWRQKDRVEGRKRTVVKGEVGAERKRPID